MFATRNACLPAIALTALGLAACGELPQDGPKDFVNAAEQRSQWDAAHVTRATVQDEYLIIPAATAVAMADAGSGAAR